jgi:hypothetical protein
MVEGINMPDPYKFGAPPEESPLSQTARILGGMMQQNLATKKAKMDAERELELKKYKNTALEEFNNVLADPNITSEQLLHHGFRTANKVNQMGDSKTADDVIGISKIIASEKQKKSNLKPMVLSQDTTFPSGVTHKAGTKVYGYEATDTAGNTTILPTDAIAPSTTPTMDKLISSRVGTDNVKYDTMQKPDNTTYEVPRGDVRQSMGGVTPGQGFDSLSQADKDVWYEQYTTDPNKAIPPMATRDIASRVAFTKGYPDYLRRQGITPTDAVVQRAEMGAMKGSLANQQKVKNMMGSFARNMDFQVKRLKVFVDKINRLDTRLLKGSANESVLSMYLTDISNDAAKLSTGSSASISELSESAQDRWAKIHDPNLSVGEMLKLVEETQQAAHGRISSADEEIAQTKKEMQQVGKKKDPDKPQPSGQPKPVDDPLGIF